MSETGVAEIHGAVLHYERAGRGPAVVLLHAGIADSRMWEPQVEALRQRFDAIRLDLRGYGRSPMVAGQYAHATDVIGLLDHLGIPAAHLVGCSLGSATVLDVALAAPERAASLFLESPALGGFHFDVEPLEIDQAIERAEEKGDLDAVNELEIQKWVDGPTRATGEVPTEIRELVRDMNRIALTAPSLGEQLALTPPAAELLAEIRQPSRIVLGELDVACTRATGRFLQAQLPGSQLIEIAATAHFPNLEKPELFNRLLLEFLDDQTRESPGPAEPERP